MVDQIKLRIIIIDDNQDIRNDFIKILTRSSSGRSSLKDAEQQLFGNNTKRVNKNLFPEFHIDTASQGQEGVEKIAQNIKEGNPYSLAFVDIRMPPGWDGIETIKHIWALDPDIQIVICTAYSDYSWEETVEQLGDRENLLILKKPFDAVAVRQLSCALTKKWQLLQETREHTRSLNKMVADRTESLEESLSITRGTLESSEDGILVIGTENKIINHNNNMGSIFSISDNIFNTNNAHTVFEFIATKIEGPEKFLETVKKILSEEVDLNTTKLHSKDDRVFEIHVEPFKRNDQIAGTVWSFRDITARVRLEEKIQHQATHDELTGLPNRALLTDCIRGAIDVSKNNHVPFGVLFFDLDRFKLINDSFSHLAGDELLQSVSDRLKSVSRDIDVLGRLGGDEFVGVITSLKHEKDLEKIAEKFLNVFREPFKIAEHEITVTCSMGISMFPRDGKDYSELLRCADVAMYKSKELGGNQAQFYAANFSQHILENLEIETDLRNALTNNEFFLCYQPQFNLITHELISVEALVRWKHPKKGILLPVDFIPIAEQTGLIVPLGEWVLRMACKQNKMWQEEGLLPIRIAVNLASAQLKQANLVTTIVDILQEIGLKPEYLEIELTENIIISNIEAIHVVSKLKEIGVSIALDDFGTGYSSINYLRKLPLDRIKIDKTFVENINVNRSDEVIIQAIISLATNMNLEVVAEGVETQNQLDFLETNKCNEIQGFYFSKPLIADEMEKLLKNPEKGK